MIHSYHQTRVKDRTAYGKAFGRVLMLFGAAPLSSGAIACFGRSNILVIVAVAVLLAGIVIGFALLLRVQRKYNGGLF